VEPGPSPIENLIEKGMDALEVEKGDPDLCVLTDATSVKIEGNTTEKYIDFKYFLSLSHRPISLNVLGTYEVSQREIWA